RLFRGDRVAVILLFNRTARKIPLAAQQMCQPCVTRVTLEKGCKRPVHRHCVSVSTFFSKKHIKFPFFVNFLNFNVTLLSPSVTLRQGANPL
ncbi:MAG: hypothetical protein IJP74_01180, partial [Prevotella sp.]|nr:hypothetical protein [Prevotella sp.]